MLETARAAWGMSTVVSVPVVTLNGEPVIAVYAGAVAVPTGATGVAVGSRTIEPTVQVPVEEGRVIVNGADPEFMLPTIPEASRRTPAELYSWIVSPAVIPARPVASVRVSTVWGLPSTKIAPFTLTAERVKPLAPEEFVRTSEVMEAYEPRDSH